MLPPSACAFPVGASLNVAPVSRFISQFVDDQVERAHRAAAREANLAIAHAAGAVNGDGAREASETGVSVVTARISSARPEAQLASVSRSEARRDLQAKVAFVTQWVTEGTHYP
jgi:hypothetical protein